jgi:hypothetical protein
MSEQKVDSYMSGVSRDPKQAHSSDDIRELGAEDLSAVSGAGLKEAIGAYSHAGKLGGSFSARLSSFWRGLKCKDEKVANARASRIVKSEKKNQELQKIFREQKKRQYTGF